MEWEAEAEFEAAAACVAQLAAERQLSEADLLALYACYKQVSCGPCRGPRPGLLSLTARRKYDAWKALERLSAAEAARRYVERLTELRPQWRQSVQDQQPPRPLGVFVSRPQRCAEDEPSGESLWDLVKSGRHQQLERLDAAASSWDAADPAGLTPLHWAADRGHLQVARLLLARGASVNARDTDGQTPLHYAASCGHTQVALLLVRAGADRGARDADGETPADAASGAELAALLAEDT